MSRGDSLTPTVQDITMHTRDIPIRSITSSSSIPPDFNSMTASQRQQYYYEQYYKLENIIRSQTGGSIPPSVRELLDQMLFQIKYGESMGLSPSDILAFINFGYEAFSVEENSIILTPHKASNGNNTRREDEAFISIYQRKKDNEDNQSGVVKHEILSLLPKLDTLLNDALSGKGNTVTQYRELRKLPENMTDPERFQYMYNTSPEFRAQALKDYGDDPVTTYTQRYEQYYKPQLGQINDPITLYDQWNASITKYTNTLNQIKTNIQNAKTTEEANKYYSQYQSNATELKRIVNTNPLSPDGKIMFTKYITPQVQQGGGAAVNEAYNRAQIGGGQPAFTSEQQAKDLGYTKVTDGDTTRWQKLTDLSTPQASSLVLGELKNKGITGSDANTIKDIALVQIAKGYDLQGAITSAENIVKGDQNRLVINNMKNIESLSDIFNTTMNVSSKIISDQNAKIVIKDGEKNMELPKPYLSNISENLPTPYISTPLPTPYKSDIDSPKGNWLLDYGLQSGSDVYQKYTKLEEMIPSGPGYNVITALPQTWIGLPFLAESIVPFGSSLVGAGYMAVTQPGKTANIAPKVLTDLVIGNYEMARDYPGLFWGSTIGGSAFGKGVSVVGGKAIEVIPKPNIPAGKIASVGSADIAGEVSGLKQLTLLNKPIVGIITTDEGSKLYIGSPSKILKTKSFEIPTGYSAEFVEGAKPMSPAIRSVLRPFVGETESIKGLSEYVGIGEELAKESEKLPYKQANPIGTIEQQAISQPSQVNLYTELSKLGTGAQQVGSRLMADVIGKEYFRDVTASDFDIDIAKSKMLSASKTFSNAIKEGQESVGKPADKSLLPRDMQSQPDMLIATSEKGEPIGFGGKPTTTSTPFEKPTSSGFHIAEVGSNIDKTIRIVGTQTKEETIGVKVRPYESVGGTIYGGTPEYGYLSKLSRAFGESKGGKPAGVFSYSKETGKTELIAKKIPKSKDIIDIVAIQRYISKTAAESGKPLLAKRYETASLVMEDIAKKAKVWDDKAIPKNIITESKPKNIDLSKILGIGLPKISSKSISTTKSGYNLASDKSAKPPKLFVIPSIKKDNDNYPKRTSKPYDYPYPSISKTSKTYDIYPKFTTPSNPYPSISKTTKSYDISTLNVTTTYPSKTEYPSNTQYPSSKPTTDNYPSSNISKNNIYASNKIGISKNFADISYIMEKTNVKKKKEEEINFFKRRKNEKIVRVTREAPILSPMQVLTGVSPTGKYENYDWSTPKVSKYITKRAKTSKYSERLQPEFLLNNSMKKNSINISSNINKIQSKLRKVKVIKKK